MLSRYVQAVSRHSVNSPDGTSWTVARALLPWRLRLRREKTGVAIFEPVTLLLQVASLLLVVVEAALALVIVPLRLLLRRPWQVEAVTGGPPRQRLTWRIRGFRAAAAHAEAVAAAIAEGGEGPIPPDERQVG